MNIFAIYVRIHMNIKPAAAFVAAGFAAFVAAGFAATAFAATAVVSSPVESFAAQKYFRGEALERWSCVYLHNLQV